MVDIKERYEGRPGRSVRSVQKPWEVRMRSICRTIEQSRRQMCSKGLATADEEKFIKFSLHKAIDALLVPWRLDEKACGTAVEQIGIQFSSPYIREVLQRLGQEA